MEHQEEQYQYQYQYQYQDQHQYQQQEYLLYQEITPIITPGKESPSTRDEILTEILEQWDSLSETTKDRIVDILI